MGNGAETRLRATDLLQISMDKKGAVQWTALAELVYM